MSQGQPKPKQIRLWQLFFWLTLASIYIAVGAAIYRHEPMMSPFVVGILVGALVVFYRTKRHRDRNREQRISD